MKTQTQTQMQRSPASQNTALSTTTSTSTKRKHKEVWLIEEHPNRKAWWTRIGAAFENADGSWNLELSAVPTNGNRLQIRDPRPAVDAANDDSVNAAVAA
ncbi:MAG: hypothetical protein Q8O67_16065 [Deltaproteobacteria bacterium]|nr:hypothetical protein [Deltaproteobacteria bacterium]